MLLASKNRAFNFGNQIAILGVLNVTPDSFVPDSRVQTIEEVVARAKKFREDGADILDIGGESTGPNSDTVGLEEELQRVIPAVRAIREAMPDMVLSVDTFKAEVAKQSLQAGASIVNDVTAGRGDPGMLRVIAASGARYVMMYAKDASARTTVAATGYENVIDTIHAFLSERIVEAEKAGINRECIIIDPGLGHFVSSDARYSWKILRNLERFKDLGPVLVSPSRKSFLACPSSLPVSERLIPTLVATVIAAEHGAKFIRTHDVRETRRALDALEHS